MIFSDVLDAIDSMSRGELNTIVDGIRQRRAVLERAAKAAFYPGCHIRFVSTKYGNTVYATVTKVCSRNLKATATDGMRWTVNPTMCTKIAALPGWA